jgi:hypothetical protein
MKLMKVDLRWNYLQTGSGQDRLP